MRVRTRRPWARTFEKKLVRIGTDEPVNGERDGTETFGQPNPCRSFAKHENATTGEHYNKVKDVRKRCLIVESAVRLSVGLGKFPERERMSFIGHVRS